MFGESFKGVYKKFQECFKEVSTKIEGGFKGI